MENPNSLSNDLEKVFNTEMFSDITLSVDGQLFSAHKILLAARSDVFADKLLEYSEEEVIEIDDVNAEIMEEMLRYIYTEKVEKIDQLAMELLIAADKYRLEGLKIICGRALLRTVSVSNALDIFKMASKYNADELKRKIISFISLHKSKLMNTQAWQELQFDESNFKMLKEIFEVFNQVKSDMVGIYVDMAETMIGNHSTNPQKTSASHSLNTPQVSTATFNSSTQSSLAASSNAMICPRQMSTQMGMGNMPRPRSMPGLNPSLSYPYRHRPYSTS